VATTVGGVPGAVGDAALLIPPNDPGRAVGGLLRIADEPILRTRMVDRGLALARRHTIESECQRLADFLQGPNRSCSKRLDDTAVARLAISS
jgi:glycosyltransferase involved in cell wall biosynthesis